MTADTLVSIPGYTIHRLVGEGGMAKVYLATQDSLQRQVAIKVLLNPSDEQFAKRFMAEARTIAALNHSRVITIYDVAQMGDGCLYFVMEYLKGGDLSRFKGEVLAPNDALKYVLQIAQGVQVIHAKGIIHRDIKPANILFREDGSLVLSDFGIAKNTQQNIDLTQSGCSVGSPSYGSPEQTMEKNADGRTDIYSLGVVLLEMLLGRNPFAGSSIAETAINHMQMEMPCLPVALEAYQPLVHRMLAKKPDDRFSDVAALIVAINNALRYSSAQGDDTLITVLSDAASVDQKESSGGLLKKSIFSLVALMCFLLAVFFFTFESATDKKIKQYMQSAQLSLEQARFYEPKSNNAEHYFKEVLLLNGTHEGALLGLRGIKDTQIKFYMRTGLEREKNQQFSVPVNDNAIYYYGKVLALSPGHQQAKQGLDRLVDHYVVLSQQAFMENNYKKGFQYLKQGLELDPNNEVLIRLKEAHKNQSNAFKRLFNRVFK